CSPQKRLAVDPLKLRNILILTDCWHSGIELDAGRIDLCTRAVGVAQYVLPRLRSTNDGWRLEVEYHAGGEPRADKTFEHQLSQVQLLKLAPHERGESRWHSELVDCALRAQDDELVAALLDLWEQDGQNYPNCVSRGAILLAWGQQARSRVDEHYRVSFTDVQ